MTSTVQSLHAFLDAAPAVALVEVADAKGSTPREKGAWMLVSPVAIYGTIGGGQLEYMAIDKAREVLWRAVARPAARSARHPARPRDRPMLRRPRRGGDIAASTGQARGLAEGSGSRGGAAAARLIFGGGHVGHALAAAFALLPVRPVVVETRADALEGMPADVETRLTPMPEEMVREAPAGAAFVVLTHDHALDFLIVAEALKREDAAYVGMIGSKTKKATFRSWFLKTAGGSEDEFARLVSPIGGDAVKDKRPAVIAALAAAEIMTALAGTT